MDELLRQLFGESVDPIRRDLKVRLAPGEDGIERAQATEALAFVVSGEGSIDRVQVSQDRFYHCGCTQERPLGGQCGVVGCGRTSCSDCFARCLRCQKPTCLEHARSVEHDGIATRPFCLECLDAVQQRIFWNRWTVGLIPLPPQL